MVSKHWQQLEKKYAALSLRERAMVALAILAAVVYLGNALWVGPIFARAENFARQTKQQEKELLELQSQLDMLQAKIAVDPNAALKKSLAEVGQQTAAVDARLREFESSLVPPERMGAVLGNLLRQVKGVRLLSLKTLPAEALLGGGKGAQDEPAPAVNMFKHGFELKIEGNYLDLMAYVAELEKQPQQLLWQRASLTVPEYPTAQLTLTFFSLSLDKDWLAL